MTLAPLHTHTHARSLYSHAHAHKGICDAESDNTPSRDPTRTTDLRHRLDTYLRKAAHDFRKLLKAQVLGHNVLALKSATPLAMHERLANFSGVAQSASSRSMNVTQKLSDVAMEAYRRGRKKASEEIGIDLIRKITPADVNLYVVESMAEVRGIMEATLQQLTRAASVALASDRTPGETWAALNTVLRRIADFRLKNISQTLMPMVYNHAKLYAYKEAGVTHVGAVVETLTKSLGKITKRTFRTGDAIPPHVLVFSPNVQVALATTGDEVVCPVCEDLEGHIYDIDEAFGVIPVHPRCRCVWIPQAGIKEFKKQLRSERGVS